MSQISVKILHEPTHRYIGNPRRLVPTLADVRSED